MASHRVQCPSTLVVGIIFWIVRWSGQSSSEQIVLKTVMALAERKSDIMDQLEKFSRCKRISDVLLNTFSLEISPLFSPQSNPQNWILSERCFDNRNEVEYVWNQSRLESGEWFYRKYNALVIFSFDGHSQGQLGRDFR